MKRRIEWIDVGKAILIILVVYGHCTQSLYYNANLINMIRKIIYSFHMPAFFFISGLVFNDANTTTFVKFIKKKYRSLLGIGYIGIIMCFFYNLFMSGNHLLYIQKVFCVRNLLMQLLWMNGAELGYWFLAALFTLEIIMFCIHKNLKNSSFQMLVSMLLLSVGLMIAELFVTSSKLPFAMIQALISAPFFEVGIQLKKLNMVRGKCSNYLLYVLVGGGITILSSLLTPFEHNVGVWCAGVGEMQWYLVGGMGGCVMVTGLAKYIVTAKYLWWLKKILIIIGQNSLFVYMYHGVIISISLLFIKRFNIKNSVLDVMVMGWTIGITLLVVGFVVLIKSAWSICGKREFG